MRIAFENPTAIMGASRLLVAVLGLAATPLLTRVLSAEEYGSFAIAITIVAFSATVPTQWLTSATLRYAAEVDQESLFRLSRRGVSLSAIPVMLLAALGSLWAFHDHRTIIVVTIAYALSEALFTVLWVRSRATLQAWRFAAGGILRNSVSVVSIATMALLNMPINLAAVLALMAVSNLTASIAIGLRSRKIAPITGQGKGHLRRWFVYGWPLILNYALGLALAYVDRFMILSILGVSAVGRFAPTYDLLFAMITLTTALIGLTAVPRLFATKDRSSQLAQLRRLRFRVVGVSILMGISLVACWPQLSRILIGESVRVTDWFFISTLAASFVMMAYRFQYVNIVIQLSEKTKVQTYATAAALATNVGANLVLIPNIGLNGAALSTLVGSAVALGFVPIWTTLTNDRGMDR